MAIWLGAAAASLIPRFWESVDGTDGIADQWLKNKTQDQWQLCVDLLKQKAGKHLFLVSSKAFGDFMFGKLFFKSCWEWTCDVFDFLKAFYDAPSETIASWWDKICERVAAFIEKLRETCEWLVKTQDASTLPQPANGMDVSLAKASPLSLLDVPHWLQQLGKHVGDGIKWSGQKLWAFFTSTFTQVLSWLTTCWSKATRELVKYAMQIHACVEYITERIGQAVLGKSCIIGVLDKKELSRTRRCHSSAP
jgi:hypothetical protein